MTSLKTLVYVYGCFAYMFVCIMCAPGIQGVWETVLGSRELELQMVVCHHVGVGPKVKSRFSDENC